MNLYLNPSDIESTLKKRSSAHSIKMKMAVLVEEGLRRLRNYSRGLVWERSRAEMER